MNSDSSCEGTPVKGRLSLKRSRISSDEEEDSEMKVNNKNKQSKPQPTTYDPSIAKYDPVSDVIWKKDEKVPYLALAKTLQAIEAVSSRLRMIEILSNFLSSVLILSPNDATPAVYLCLNKLAPDYKGIELGIGDSIIMKSLAEATGRKPAQIKSEVEKKGDLGLVAESCRSNQRVMFPPPILTVSSVFTKLKEIALVSGNSSMNKKSDMIKKLIVACRECEARYLVRSLSGKLRIGLAEQSLLVALSQAVVTLESVTSENPVIDRNSDRFKSRTAVVESLIKVAQCECPDYEKIMEVILKSGVDSLPERCKITPGIPVRPMLAHPSKGVEEVLKRFDKNCFTCEYKYDGERAQIHLSEGENQRINVFSRNQENNTSKYPDMNTIMSEVVRPSVTSYIIDSEAVAIDKESGKILPFQVLSTRKRKDVKEEDIKVRVCIFAFDILFLNGESLVKRPLRERRKLLQESFQETDGRFYFAQGKDVSQLDEIQELIDQAVKDRCEGLMVKCLDEDATYEIAKRSRNWLKLKKDYLEGVGDSLDIVVIGAWFGKGKRTGTFGGFLLACYNPAEEEYQTVCKLGTGFKDEDLEQHSTFLKQHIISEPKSYYNYDEGIKPDVWFDAVQVWEVKCADLSVSPVHRAAVGIIDESKGISLRFPRFIRIREDKKPEHATTADQVAEMYRNQDSVRENDENEEDTESTDDPTFATQDS